MYSYSLNMHSSWRRRKEVPIFTPLAVLGRAAGTCCTTLGFYDFLPSVRVPCEEKHFQFSNFSSQFAIPSFSKSCFIPSIHRFLGCPLGLFPRGFPLTRRFKVLRVWPSHHMPPPPKPFDSVCFFYSLLSFELLSIPGSLCSFSHASQRPSSLSYTGPQTILSIFCSRTT